MKSKTRARRLAAAALYAAMGRPHPPPAMHSRGEAKMRWRSRDPGARRVRYVSRVSQSERLVNQSFSINASSFNACLDRRPPSSWGAAQPHAYLDVIRTGTLRTASHAAALHSA